MAVSTLPQKVILIIERDRKRADMYFKNMSDQARGHILVRVDAPDAKAGLDILRKRRVDIVVCSGSVMTPEKALTHLGEAPYE